MKNKTRHLTPLQVVMVAVILIAVAIYRLIVPSTAPTQTPDSPSEAIHSSTLPPAAQVQQEAPRPTDTATDAPAPDKISSAVPDTTSMRAFDYFVLSLSWSPDYCAANGSQDGQQCAIGKKLGFVLHGLWPQNNVGYPSSCSTEKLTAQIKTQFSGLYPNDSLADHEWEKHGTCTGLPAQQYLSLTRQLKKSITIPAEFTSPLAPFRSTSNKLIDAFTTANPSLTGASLAVNCSSSGRYLSELYVCFSREGQPTSCSAEVEKNAAKSCKNSDFLVRNTR
jgi:ribonuclease T2